MTDTTPTSPTTSSRWTSRKFILSVAAQAAAVAVLFWPGHQDAIVQASQSIASLLVIVLNTLGYLHIEGSIDRAKQS